MDGSSVDVGDHVYDVLLGTGMVTESHPQNGFAVTFDTGRSFRYDIEGRFHGQKRAYWANPIMRVPKKVDLKRPLINEIIMVIDNV